MAQSFARMQASINSNDNDFPALSTLPPTPNHGSSSTFTGQQSVISSYSQVGVPQGGVNGIGMNGGALSPGPGGITREFASEFPNLNTSSQRIVSGTVPGQGFMNELEKQRSLPPKGLNMSLPPNSQWTPSSGSLPPLSTSNGQFDPPRSPSLLPATSRTGSSPPGVGTRVVGAAGSLLPPSTANNLLASVQSASIPSAMSIPGTMVAGGSPSSTARSLNQSVTMPHHQVLFSPADRYGLLGLLHIIRSSDPDLSMLALGSDLTTLGLDLAATDNLYSSFITPWSDSKTAQALNIEPEFHLPSCYNVQPPPAQSKIGNFSDETLFFIFYSQPRDAMQEMAAHELYKHNWRYHKELRLWLTKEAGTEPSQKTQSYERGSYIFFDPTLWERVRKDFVLVFESLERKL